MFRSGRVNCGRGTGAIEFFEHARKSRIPILAIQEDGPETWRETILSTPCQ